MRRLVLVLALIALAAPALAQETGTALVFYDADGLGFEAEVHVPDQPALSGVFRLRNVEGEVPLTGGIRYRLPIGPVMIFGHYLYGDVGTDMDPDNDHMGGGGVEVPLHRSWFLRVSADTSHDGDTGARVGVGVRF